MLITLKAIAALSIGALTAALGFNAPGASAESAQVSPGLAGYLSPPQKLGNGSVRTYVVAVGGKPQSMGYIFGANALEGLPKDPPNDGERCFDVDSDGTINRAQECVGGYRQHLPLPKNKGYGEPWQFAMLNWNPEGHQPIYTSPHFDFHFYLDTPKQVERIRLGRCWGATNCDDFQRAILPVPEQYMPADYQDFQGVEAMMGNHMGDPSSPEFNGQPFTKTFVYGKYDSRITFLEPMITREYLRGLQEATQSVCEPIKQPEAWQRPGWYPTAYCVRYSKKLRTYTVSLDDFSRG